MKNQKEYFKPEYFEYRTYESARQAMELAQSGGFRVYLVQNSQNSKWRIIFL